MKNETPTAAAQARFGGSTPDRHRIHHSIARSEDGSFWIPYWVRPEPPKTFPGPANTSSHIARVSESGKVISKINVINLLYKNGLEKYIAKFDDESVHMNDVEPLPDSLENEYPLFDAGDLVVSLRDLNLVFVFDPSSEVVKWHTTRPFILQHDPDFIGDGWIGIFDNRKDFTDRGEMLGGSRIVAVQPHTDSTKVLFPTAQSEPFYTDVRGKWQMLENGNLLLSETQAGRVVEVNTKGQTVWEWIHEPYNDSRVPVVTKASRHDLTPEEVASWPCSSVDSVSTSAQ